MYGVNIIPYSQIKYVSNSFSPTSKSNLFLHTGTTYDSIKTNSIDTDAIVFHPSIGIPQLPGEKTFDSLKKYEEWDIILRNAGLEIERDELGLVANRSGEIVRDIFVAGDLGCVYSPVTGRGVYSGVINAKATGRHAASNMLNRSVFNDDIPTYHMVSQELGVNIMLLGQCNTSFETHGYLQKKKAPRPLLPKDNSFMALQEESSKISVHNQGSGNIEENMGHAVGNSLQIKPNLSQISKSALHRTEVKTLPIGIVLYVDSGDIIRGVLISGDVNDKGVTFRNKAKHAYSLLGQSIDPLISLKRDDSQMKAKTAEISFPTDNRLRFEHMTKLTSQIFREIVLSDSSIQQKHMADGVIIEDSLTIQYKHTKPSHHLSQFNDSSTKNVLPISRRENLFFNTPVNISRADRITASFAKGIHGSLIS